MRLHAQHAARRAGIAPSRRRWRPEPSWNADAAEVASSGARHPLGDGVVSLALRRRAEEIDAAFAAIAPTLQALAPRQFDDGFSSYASDVIRARLQLDVPPAALASRWTAPLDLRALHARCVLGTFCRLIERAFDRGLAQLSDGESAEALIRRWGFHAIDITPCADGRLSGVVDFILRVPPSVVAYRESHAGALFDVAQSVRHWERVELGRFRDARPNPADAPTRYLKIGVYHRSSADPHHQGCAAHGSDDATAAAALLERLRQFEQAVRQIHGERAAVATLLVGVDTDTDAIRVHVPDAAGRMAIDRYADSLALFDATQALPREAGKAAIREAVASYAGVAPDDAATEGMRWFCGYLLKNNLGQLESVRDWHGGRYPDAGHTERLIVVGDAVDDVQLRNLAFQAQMRTAEEGAADLDVGIRILRVRHAPLDLPVPVLVHLRFDPRIPGAQAAAERDARRLRAAILSRHADLAASGSLHVAAVVRAGDGTLLVQVETPLARTIEAREQHA